MYFQNVPETDILESIKLLNKEGDINDVSRKILVMCKSYVSFNLREPLKFSITPGAYPNIFENV